MKTFLANAFAVVSLQTVQEFHLCRLNTNAPDCPYQSLRRFPKTNKIETTSYSIIPCTDIQAWQACFEHSNFFKVNLTAPRDTRSRAPRGLRHQSRANGAVSAKQRTAPCPPRSNYELFNRNNFNIRYWSWNYRGCWHQTCPPIVPR
jgi:hypothetical protein